MAAPRRPRRDDGFTLIEAIVAVFVLAIVVLPVTRVVIGTQSAANTLRLRAEAADLATQALECAQDHLAHGTQPSTGLTATCQGNDDEAGGDTFTISLDYQLASETGDGSLCASGGDVSSTSQIWRVTATAGWGPGTAADQAAAGDQVAETTLAAPGQLDLTQSSAGELAVQVELYPAQTPDTTDPVQIDVQGACSGTQCGSESVPSGLVTSETETTDSGGCAVFPALYAGTGWSYSATVVDGSDLVDPLTEDSDAATAPGVPAISNLNVTAGTVTGATWLLGQGNEVTVQFQEVDPSAAAPAEVPVTVYGQGATQAVVLGNGSSAFSTVAGSGQQALLAPFAAVDGSNYSAWAGDQSSETGGTTALSSGAGALTLPLYPLDLALTESSDAGQVTALAASDAGSSSTMDYPLQLSGTTSLTSLPLGAYQLSATATGNGSLAGPAGSGGLYVVITPSGTCSSNQPLTVAQCTSPSSAPIAVTVG